MSASGLAWAAVAALFAGCITWLAVTLALTARAERRRDHEAVIAYLERHRPTTRDITPDPRGLAELRTAVRHVREEDTTP